MDKITWRNLADDLKVLKTKLDNAYDRDEFNSIYAIPKNGLIIGLLLNPLCPVVYDEDRISKNTLILDDVIDSGKTLSKFQSHKKAVLYKKPNSPNVDYCVREVDDWIEFPFEKEKPAEDAIIRLLESLGEDLKREDLKRTPARVIKMYQELTAGYKQDPSQLFSSAFHSDNNSMVIVKDIEFNSTCSHHLLPFYGKVHIAYIPSGLVLGLSKFARIIEVFSHRLQKQEDLTKQIADCITQYLSPKGVMVVIEAKHLCMAIRGIKKFNSITVTSAISGSFTSAQTREEALSLIK